MMLPHLGIMLQVGYDWLAKPWMLLPSRSATRVDLGPTRTSTHAMHALSR